MLNKLIKPILLTQHVPIYDLHTVSLHLPVIMCLLIVLVESDKNCHVNSIGGSSLKIITTQRDNSQVAQH